MRDLIESLRTAARNTCERHNMVDQFDPTWERKPKDFIEWDAADRIEQLEGIIYRNCDPMAASDEDAKIIYSIAGLENKGE